MFYRIAEVVDGPNGKPVAGFCSGVASTEEQIKAFLRLREDLPRYIVFGASSLARMEADLYRYAQGRKVCAIEAAAMLRGYSFGLTVIQWREADIDQDNRGVKQASFTVFEQARLYFTLWMLEHEKLGYG